jgi:hypothetical protein
MDRAISDLSKLNKGLGTTDKTSKGLFSSFTDLTSGFMAGSAAIGKAVDFIKDAVKASSDLEETTSKFNTVFASSTYDADAAVKQLTDSYAMSTREARQYMASVQDLLVPMGMAPNAAAKLSNEVVKLSADLGSFNNLGTDQVMADIQSALVGNFETMKKYGVVLNETVVKEKAREMGLYTGKGAIDAVSRTEAAYQLILQGTEAAQGDMIRTSDSYANQLKKLEANTEDFLAAFGTPFRDALKDGMKGMDMSSEKATVLGNALGTAAGYLMQLGGAVLSGIVSPLSNAVTAYSNVANGIDNTKYHAMDLTNIVNQSVQATQVMADRALNSFSQLRTAMVQTGMDISTNFMKSVDMGNQARQKYVENKELELLKDSEFYTQIGMNREADLAKIDEYYIEVNKKHKLSYEQQLMLHNDMDRKRKEVDNRYSVFYQSMMNGIKSSFNSAFSAFETANKAAIKSALFEGKFSWDKWKSAVKDMVQNLIVDITYAITKAMILKGLMAASGSGGLLTSLILEKGRVPSFSKGNIPAYPQGNVPDDHFLAYIGRQEAVINKESTNANRSLLKTMNDNPGMEVGGIGGNSITLNISNLYATDDIPNTMAIAIDKALYKLQRNGNRLS